MQLLVDRSELQRVLAITQNIVEKKTTMPVLANVLLKATSASLQVSATDLEITAVTTAKATVEEEGALTVNAKVLHDIVRELNDATVRIHQLEGNRLEISSGGSKLKINGVSAEEFPGLPGMSIKPSVKLAARELQLMINKTLYAVSLDETWFNLNGVCFEKVEEEGEELLRLVATDGHRLATVTRTLKNLHLPQPVIVPRKGLLEIRKILDNNLDDYVEIDISEGFFVLQTSDTKVSMRLIDGEFPDYKLVIPKSSECRALVPVVPFIQALRRVSLLVTDKAKCVTLDFAPTQLKISSSSPELGEAVEDLPIDFNGEDLSMGFNAKYLLDIASTLESSDSLVIELNGPLGAGKFYPQNDESAVSVVMPMRLT
jgi:DNA polymerase III subunit beta